MHPYYTKGTAKSNERMCKHRWARYYYNQCLIPSLSQKWHEWWWGNQPRYTETMLHVDREEEGGWSLHQLTSAYFLSLWHCGHFLEHVASSSNTSWLQMAKAHCLPLLHPQGLISPPDAAGALPVLWNEGNSQKNLMLDLRFQQILVISRLHLDTNGIP